MDPKGLQDLDKSMLYPSPAMYQLGLPILQGQHHNLPSRSELFILGQSTSFNPKNPAD